MITSLRSLMSKAAPGLVTAALLWAAMSANEARAQMQAPVVSHDQGRAPARPVAPQYPPGSFYNPIQRPAPAPPYAGTPGSQPQASIDVWLNGQRYALIPFDQGVQAGSGNLVWFNGQWYVLIPVPPAPYPGQTPSIYAPAPDNRGAPPAPSAYPTAPVPSAYPTAPLQAPAGTPAPAPAAAPAGAYGL